MPTAKINVNVPIATWRPLLGPSMQMGIPTQYSPATFTFAESPPKGVNQRDYVEVADGSNLKIRGDVDLVFRFWDPADGGGNEAAGFRPVGISFFKLTDEKWPAHTDHVDADLPRHHLGYGHEAAATDRRFRVPFLKVRATRATPGAKWKYMIVIQDLHGNIGVIDPTIENDAHPA